MDFEELHRSWQHLGATDPRWAILSEPGRKGGGGDDASFWQSGVGFVGWLAQHLQGLGAMPVQDRALDFGCGIGRLTQALAQHFAAVTGVDIAESMLAAAKLANRHGERVQYEHNLRPDLSRFADGSFDFVLSMLVLQHMRPDYAAGYMAEFLRVLRPGGIAFFQLPIDPLTPPPVVGRSATAAAAPWSPTELRACTSLVPSHQSAFAGDWAWTRATVHNTGTTTLHAQPGPGAVEVGLRFQRQDGSVVAPAQWVALPHDVAPAGSADVVVVLRVPAIPAFYVLAAQPCLDRSWCSHPANVPAAISLRVAPAAPGQVRAEPPPRPAFLAPDRRQHGEIEVHGTPLRDVDRIVRAAGGELVDVTLDGWAGYEWISAHLTVRKR